VVSSVTKPARVEDAGQRIVFGRVHGDLEPRFSAVTSVSRPRMVRLAGFGGAVAAR